MERRREAGGRGRGGLTQATGKGGESEKGRDLAGTENTDSPPNTAQPKQRTHIRAIDATGDPSSSLTGGGGFGIVCLA
jgi:hypothetical protein